MTDTGHMTKAGRTIGEKVHVQCDNGMVVGTIVEDFADSLIAGDRLGRNWAQPHRWAIALDTGVLVFVDDNDLGDSDTAAER